jgi:hypothetical protein
MQRTLAHRDWDTEEQKEPPLAVLLYISFVDVHLEKGDIFTGLFFQFITIIIVCSIG